MTTLARARRRTLAAAAAPAVPQGIVTAIVAVTGHEDSVKDIIISGAFADTLTKLRPKLCWHHDWKDPLGSVLSIVEVKPGDKRLPATLPDGRAWPKGAGALIATMQFNLRTSRGRDMFEHAAEWAKNGEAAFSIGYKVREGMASKRADGVRLIYALDLYEVSLVLHGAHNMALALEVKDLAGAGVPDLETKDSPTGITEVKGAEPMIGSGAMVALYLDPDTAAQVAQDGGNPAEELHVTLAFLGDGSDVPDPQALAGQLAPAVARSGALTGSIGGIGTFPPGETGTPVWVPVDVPGLIELRQSVVAALEAAGVPQQSEHGYTPHLTLGYDLPTIEPVASTPVTFDQVFLVVGPRRIPISLVSPPVLEGKAAAAVTQARTLLSRLESKSALNAVLEAKSMFGGSAGAVTVPTLGAAEKVPCATKKRPKRKTPQEGMEVKMMSQMRGSHEERREALRAALENLLAPRAAATPAGAPVSECSVWVSIEATFDDHVLVAVEKDRDRQTYRVPYTINPADTDQVTLGVPQKVELTVVAIPDDGNDPTPVDEGDAVTMRFLDPATVQLAEATRRINAMPLEGKAAWGEFESGLLALMDALSVKGFDVAGAVIGDEPDPEDDEDEPNPDEDLDSIDQFEGAPADDLDDAEEEDEEMGPVDPSKETVTLDPEAVRAQMDELRA